MSMDEDVKRHAASYEWWDAEQATPILRQLQADLAAHPESRLCVRPGLRADGTRCTWLYVVDRDGKQVGKAFDDSFLCPPFC